MSGTPMAAPRPCTLYRPGKAGHCAGCNERPRHSPYVFNSEHGALLSAAGYQRMVARAGEAAGFGFLVHSHMLRHGYGFKLAADGQDTRALTAYLGHRSIQIHVALHHTFA